MTAKSQKISCTESNAELQAQESLHHWIPPLFRPIIDICTTFASRKSVPHAPSFWNWILINTPHTHIDIYIYCIYIYINTINISMLEIHGNINWVLKSIDFAWQSYSSPCFKNSTCNHETKTSGSVLSSRSPMKLSPTSRGVSCTNRTCHFHTGLNTFPVFAKGIKTANQISIHPILPHKVGNTSGYAMRIRCVPARIMQP